MVSSLSKPSCHWETPCSDHECPHRGEIHGGHRAWIGPPEPAVRWLWAESKIRLWPSMWTTGVWKKENSSQADPTEVWWYDWVWCCLDAAVPWQWLPELQVWLGSSQKQGRISIYLPSCRPARGTQPQKSPNLQLRDFVHWPGAGLDCSLMEWFTQEWNVVSNIQVAARVYSCVCQACDTGHHNAVCVVPQTWPQRH